MRITVKLKKLKSPEAQYVSVVRRSANQIPFRIQKASEETMIDLTSFQRIFKKADEPQAPKIAAIVVQKSDALPEVKEAIQKAGFDVTKETVNEDGTVLFAQVEAPEQGGSAIKMGEHMVLVVKGAPEQVKPYALALGNEGFVEDLLPGTAALQSVIRKACDEAKDAEGLKTVVQKSVQEYADFAMGMVEVVTPAAYKLSGEVERIQKAWFDKKKKDEEAAAAKEKPAEGAPAEDPTAPSAQEKKDVPAAPAPGSNATAAKPANEPPPTEEKKEPAAEEKKETPVEETEEGKVKKAKEKACKAEEEKNALLKPVMDAIAALASKVETVQKSVEDRVGAVETQVKETIAKSAEAAAKAATVVAAAPPPEDKPSKETVTKADEDEMGEGYFDTAIHGRPNKNRK